jgi:hypothetical protein
VATDWGEPEAWDDEPNQPNPELAPGVAQETEKFNWGVLHGWAVKSHFGTNTDGTASSAPDDMVIDDIAQSHAALTGRCGSRFEADGSWDACAVPFTGATTKHGAKVVKWWIDPTTCLADGMTQAEVVEFEVALLEMGDHMGPALNSGWTFSKASSSANAQLLYKCATNAEKTAHMQSSTGKQAVGVFSMKGALTLSGTPIQAEPRARSISATPTAQRSRTSPTPTTPTMPERFG